MQCCWQRLKMELYLARSFLKVGTGSRGCWVAGKWGTKRVLGPPLLSHTMVTESCAVKLAWVLPGLLEKRAARSLVKKEGEGWIRVCVCVYVQDRMPFPPIILVTCSHGKNVMQYFFFLPNSRNYITANHLIGYYWVSFDDVAEAFWGKKAFTVWRSSWWHLANSSMLHNQIGVNFKGRFAHGGTKCAQEWLHIRWSAPLVFTIKQTNLPMLLWVSHCADFCGCLQGCLAPQSSANVAMAAFIKHHNHISITASPMHKNAGTSHSGVLCNCLIDPYKKLTVSTLMGRHENI